MPTPSSLPINAANTAYRVWVVILHWRGIDHTIACLESVTGLTYDNFGIILVDNGSENNDGKQLKELFPAIEILRLDENHGFAGGCNRGIRDAIERGAAYVWMLNNDTKVSPQCLEILIESANRFPDAAILGATVVETIGSSERKIEAGIGKINFKKAKTSVTKGDLAPAAVPCEWVHGSNLLLKVDALNKVGLFDERYFLYFEDTELCQRMRDNGWVCLYVPQAELEHVGNASTSGKQKHWRSYYYIRNRFLFFDTYATGSTRSLAMFSMFSHLFRHALVLPFRGQEGQEKLRAEWLGMQDFLSKKFGKAACLGWCDD